MINFTPFCMKGLHLGVLPSISYELRFQGRQFRQWPVRCCSYFGDTVAPRHPHLLLCYLNEYIELKSLAGLLSAQMRRSTASVSTKDLAYRPCVLLLPARMCILHSLYASLLSHEILHFSRGWLKPWQLVLRFQLKLEAQY